MEAVKPGVVFNMRNKTNNFTKYFIEVANPYNVQGFNFLVYFSTGDVRGCPLSRFH